MKIPKHKEQKRKIHQNIRLTNEKSRTQPRASDDSEDERERENGVREGKTGQDKKPPRGVITEDDHGSKEEETD